MVFDSDELAQLLDAVEWQWADLSAGIFTTSNRPSSLAACSQRYLLVVACNCHTRVVCEFSELPLQLTPQRTAHLTPPCATERLSSRFAAQSLSVYAMMWSDRTPHLWCVQVIGRLTRNRPTLEFDDFRIFRARCVTSHDRRNAAKVWPKASDAVWHPAGSGHESHCPSCQTRVSAGLAPSRPGSSTISFTCRRSSDIRIPSSVHWTLQFRMTISLASVGPDPVICSRVSQRFRGNFRAASTSDLGPASKMSSPCTTPNFTVSAALILCSTPRCHDLAAHLVPYKQRLSLPQHLVRGSRSW